MSDPIDTVIGQDEAGRDVTARAALLRAKDREADLLRRLYEVEARIADLQARAERPADLSVDDALRALYQRFGHGYVDLSCFGSSPVVYVGRGREGQPVQLMGEDVSAAVREALAPSPKNEGEPDA